MAAQLGKEKQVLVIKGVKTNTMNCKVASQPPKNKKQNPTLPFVVQSQPHSSFDHIISTQVMQSWLLLQWLPDLKL